MWYAQVWRPGPEYEKGHDPVGDEGFAERVSHRFKGE